MTDWHELLDAYGTADAVPALLDRGQSDDHAVWDELWSRLCHQGTVQSASYAALPRLAELATGRPPAGYVQPLLLATSILASTDGPEHPSAVRAKYSQTVQVLNQMALRNLGLATGPTEFVYGLQSLLATETTTLWASRLQALADEELELSCSRCIEQLLMDLVATPAAVRSFDDVSLGVTKTVCASPDHLDPVEQRLYALAREHNQDAVANGLLSLFGTMECPACGFTASVRSNLQ